MDRQNARLYSWLEKEALRCKARLDVNEILAKVELLAARHENDEILGKKNSDTLAWLEKEGLVKPNFQPKDDSDSDEEVGHDRTVENQAMIDQFVEEYKSQILRMHQQNEIVSSWIEEELMGEGELRYHMDLAKKALLELEEYHPKLNLWAKKDPIVQFLLEKELRCKGALTNNMKVAEDTLLNMDYYKPKLQNLAEEKEIYDETLSAIARKDGSNLESEAEPHSTVSESLAGDSSSRLKEDLPTEQELYNYARKGKAILESGEETAKERLSKLQLGR